MITQQPASFTLAPTATASPLQREAVLNMPPNLYSASQLGLVALLPADGSGLQTRALASAADMPIYVVLDALFDLYITKVIDFDVRTDTFSLPAHSPLAAHLANPMTQSQTFLSTTSGANRGH